MGRPPGDMKFSETASTQSTAGRASRNRAKWRVRRPIPWPRSGLERVMVGPLAASTARAGARAAPLRLGRDDPAALVGALLRRGGLDPALALAGVLPRAPVRRSGAGALALAGVDAGALDRLLRRVLGLLRGLGPAGGEHGADGGGDEGAPHGVSSHDLSSPRTSRSSECHALNARRRAGSTEEPLAPHGTRSRYRSVTSPSSSRGPRPSRGRPARARWPASGRSRSGGC